MPTVDHPKSARLLLVREGLVCCGPGAQPHPDEATLQASEVLLAELGYVISTRLRQRLGTLAPQELRGLLGWVRSALALHAGVEVPHTPLFRKFPHELPPDTLKLWWQKVGVYYFQGQDEPCLFCGASGTTHVLSPCRHVICDRCFDGSNYSACPACEQPVDRGSPFFKELPERVTPDEQHVRFKRLDLIDAVEPAARRLFESFCARTQAMAPADLDALATLVAEHDVLTWLPEQIPVRENVAHIYGALARRYDPQWVFNAADRHMRTATDALRFLAAFSGADPALQAEKRVVGVVGRKPVTHNVKRFRMAKLPRPLRRALLGWLELRPQEALWEDMRRHASLWVWAGEFLHPHEHARRFPNVAEGFAQVRKYRPDGTRVPRHRGFASRVEAALKDPAALVALLATRPGEFARRLDLALRASDEAGAQRVLDAFEGCASRMATPVLLTLRAHLPARRSFWPVRMFWPKGPQARAVVKGDWRPLLPAAVTERATAIIDRALLARFAELPALDDVVLDEALAGIPVPFNERTASRSTAINLPRGSRWSLEAEARPKAVWRLFLHWCEPERDGHTTDLDLSVAFYDEQWNYVGVCSYYQLRHPADGEGWPVATSAGDMRAAPPPDGATEYIDLSRDRALTEGIRYAAMVVNAYAGMAFSELERAYAGLMVRDDAGGSYFDPRTVALKFALAGEHGVFMPLVIDLEAAELHWLDVYERGHLEMNNVESSKAAIDRIGKHMLAYFGAGVRPSMLQLARLHAAARARRVFVRGPQGLGCHERGDDTAEAFLARLATPAPATSATPGGQVLAALLVGDMALPDDAQVYCLQAARLHGNLAAADLLS